LNSKIYLGSLARKNGIVLEKIDRGFKNPTIRNISYVNGIGITFFKKIIIER